MSGTQNGPTQGTGGDEGRRRAGLVPQEFLRVIAVWSLVPSYLLAGALLGYVADRAVGWFPYLTGAGLLVALVFAVRDMMRLRDEL
jgi:hypothetical protein